MNGSERYHLAAPLPAVAGWRRALALDRRPGAPGPVVLSFAPAAVLEDAVRLTALVRDAEAAARIAHPHVQAVLGLETVDEQLALVEPYCAGTTVRGLLDASGRLPPDLAVRVAVDAAAGLAALHAVDAGDGQPLAHGALTAERLLVAEDGAVRVTGVGASHGGTVAGDVGALAAVIHEALSGEPPASPPAPLDVPGIPPGLAVVVDGALGGRGAFSSATAFAAALSGAVPPAPVEALAAYAEAVRPATVSPPGTVAPAPAPPPPQLAVPPIPAPRPPPVPVRFATSELLEVSAELVAPAAEPEPARPPSDAAITFPAPQATPDGRGKALALVAACLAGGLAVGFALARLVPGTAPTRALPPAAAPMAAAAPPAVAKPPPAAAPSAAQPAPAPTPPSPPAATSAPALPAARRSEPTRPGPSFAVSANVAAEVLVDGKRAGRAPVTVPVAAGEHEVRLSEPSLGVDARRRVAAKGPATPVRFDLVRGELQITAPPDAEIWVDGRRVAAGNATLPLWEGLHRVEARRGSARVQKKFEVTSVQTQWTFDVTPTP